jgi:hypothetical protein
MHFRATCPEHELDIKQGSLTIQTHPIQCPRCLQVIDSKPPQCRQRSRCATPEAEPSSPVCDGVDTASAFQPAAAAAAAAARLSQPSRHLRRSASPPAEAPDKRDK